MGERRVLSQRGEPLGPRGARWAPWRGPPTGPRHRGIWSLVARLVDSLRQIAIYTKKYFQRHGAFRETGRRHERKQGFRDQIDLTLYSREGELEAIFITIITTTISTAMTSSPITIREQWRRTKKYEVERTLN